ncbi:hypothetical protein [Pseudonocardia sp. T1-2H]|uniref:hypothetical protein n=1 Tax=Pseudonocardia sp. T1-2H TaxID=3128899 RepID=UPI003100CB45
MTVPPRRLRRGHSCPHCGLTLVYPMSGTTLLCPTSQRTYEIGAVADIGQARVELRCDRCGRSSADSDRDMAAPVVFFVRQGLCHPCSRSTASPDAEPSGDLGQAREPDPACQGSCRHCGAAEDQLCRPGCPCDEGAEPAGRAGADRGHLFTPDEIVAGVERAVGEREFAVIPGLVKLLARQDPGRAQEVLDALRGRVRVTVTVDLGEVLARG